MARHCNILRETPETYPRPVRAAAVSATDVRAQFPPQRRFRKLKSRQPASGTEHAANGLWHIYFDALQVPRTGTSIGFPLGLAGYTSSPRTRAGRKVRSEETTPWVDPIVPIDICVTARPGHLRT